MHLLAAQAELEGHGLDRRVVGQRVGRDERGVVRDGRQQVAGAEVAGAHPLVPRHPGRRQQRAVAGQQHDLVDGGRPTARARAPA